MEKKQARAICCLRICAFSLAAALIVLGISRDEMDVVLKKAVRICLECIGVA